MKNSKEYQKQYMQKRRKSAKDAPKAAQIEQEMREQFETAKARLESGLEKCLPGSNAHTKLVTEISKLEREYRQERASRGLDPQSLGTAVRPSWNFVCRVGVSGNVTCTEVPQDQVEQALHDRNRAEAEHLKKLQQPGDDELRAALDREFGFGPDGTKGIEE